MRGRRACGTVKDTRHGLGSPRCLAVQHIRRWTTLLRGCMMRARSAQWGRDLLLGGGFGRGWPLGGTLGQRGVLLAAVGLLLALIHCISRQLRACSAFVSSWRSAPPCAASELGSRQTVDQGVCSCQCSTCNVLHCCAHNLCVQGRTASALHSPAVCKLWRKQHAAQGQCF